MPVAPYAVVNLDPAVRGWWRRQLLAGLLWVGVFAALQGAIIGVKLLAPQWIETYFPITGLPLWSYAIPPATATLLAGPLALVWWVRRMKEGPAKRNRAARMLVKRLDPQLAATLGDSVLCEVLARSCVASVGQTGSLSFKELEKFEAKIGRRLPRVWILAGSAELIRLDADGGSTEATEVNVFKGKTGPGQSFVEDALVARLWSAFGRRLGLVHLLGSSALGGNRTRSRLRVGSRKWLLRSEHGMASLVKRSGDKDRAEIGIDRGALIVIGRECFDHATDEPGSQTYTGSTAWRFFQESQPSAFEAFDVVATRELPWWRVIALACEEMTGNAAEPKPEAQPKARTRTAAPSVSPRPTFQRRAPSTDAPTLPIAAIGTAPTADEMSRALDDELDEIMGSLGRGAA